MTIMAHTHQEYKGKGLQSTLYLKTPLEYAHRYITWSERNQCSYHIFRYNTDILHNTDTQPWPFWCVYKRGFIVYHLPFLSKAGWQKLSGR